MALSLAYEAKKTSRAVAALERFASSARMFKKGAGPIHDLLIRYVQGFFLTQGADLLGSPWPKYTGDETQYAAIKKKIMSKEGSKERANWKLRWAKGKERLFPSLVRKGHPQHIWDVDGKGLKIRFGTSVPYALKHQRGLGSGPEWAGNPKIKERQFLGKTKRMVADIRREISKAVGI